MSTVTIKSLIIGFSTAVGFFWIAVLFSAIRRCAFTCSKEERAKRKSIREVLNSIRSGSQMDRFSAYRTAKMDQFSAFRSATMDQLSAFTTAKISKLRTYKQMTVTNVLQHLERMRQHYALQTTRIKENCSVQVERLRENYNAQKQKLKGQRSQQMRKIRENYNAQTLRIREYRAQQMMRLREQYKLQQQHLLKLLELLDIGNCVTVIEAECVRTESTIFDADIAFDIEAQSIHVPQDPASGELCNVSESSSLTDDHKEDDEFEEISMEKIDIENILAQLDANVTLEEIPIGDISLETILGSVKRETVSGGRGSKTGEAEGGQTLLKGNLPIETTSGLVTHKVVQTPSMGKFPIEAISGSFNHGKSGGVTSQALIRQGVKVEEMVEACMTPKTENMVRAQIEIPVSLIDDIDGEVVVETVM